MINTYSLFLASENPSLILRLFADVDKETLAVAVVVLSVLLLLMIVYEIWRILRSKGKGTIWRPFFRLKLLVHLDKDRVFNPQMLTMTIKNIGKREVEINAPVLEFRKIWSKRKFKLSGVNGNYIYPMYIGPEAKHQLFIETSRFHQYDHEIKSYYWACIYVTDIEGRKWKSNDVKLRKSLVT